MRDVQTRAMTFHAIIVSLIAAALLMCSLSLVGDAVLWYRQMRLRPRAIRHGTSARDYPHPIPDEYPLERVPLQASSVSRVNRGAPASAPARRHWRISGAAMSEMRAVFGAGEKSRRTSAAR
jgi:hypothetical protein